MSRPKFMKAAASAIVSTLLAGLAFGVQAAPKAKEAPAAKETVRPSVSYGIGRLATRSEIAAWDIDVRPDFKGLPKGSGSVDRGAELFEAKCAVCHGTFGESNEVFTPLIGGTTKDDIATGHVKALRTGEVPQRTTIMKVATLSTLYDYINRAMPWNAPKSLKPDDVYAILAYLLNLAEVVPADHVLSDKNIADAQKRMPNRNGMTTAHGMWGIKDKPDVQAVACMKDCQVPETFTSILPDYARNAHGNNAEQNRKIGPVRGADTSKPASEKAAQQAILASGGTPKVVNPAVELMGKNACTGCHATSQKLVGPSWTDVAAKYKGDAGAEGKLVAKVKAGGSGNWGTVPMPAHAHVADADIATMVKYVLGGAK